MIYSQSRILYEIIPDAPRPTHSVEKPNPRPHANGVVGLVKSPSVDSLEKQIHEFSIKQFTTEAAKSTPSPQNANIFAQSSQKGESAAWGEKEKGEER